MAILESYIVAFTMLISIKELLSRAYLSPPLRYVKQLVRVDTMLKHSLQITIAFLAATSPSFDIVYSSTKLAQLLPLNYAFLTRTRRSQPRVENKQAGYRARPFPVFHFCHQTLITPYIYPNIPRTFTTKKATTKITKDGLITNNQIIRLKKVLA
jgi:hypothetical protein